MERNNSVLFTPAKVGDVEIKNRFVHSATFESMADQNGAVTDALVKRYRSLAKGEVGLIIPGYMYVHPLGRTKNAQMGIHDDSMVPGLKKLVEAIQQEGGKVAFNWCMWDGKRPKMVAMGHPNVYLSLCLLIPWAVNAPRKFAKILGEAFRFVGPDRIIWGTDYAGFAIQFKFAVQGFREFQFPQDMMEDYGYPEITDEDRRKIFGGNLAGLLGIDATKRRVKV